MTIILRNVNSYSDDFHFEHATAGIVTKHNFAAPLYNPDYFYLALPIVNFSKKWKRKIAVNFSSNLLHSVDEVFRMPSLGCLCKQRKTYITSNGQFGQ